MARFATSRPETVDAARIAEIHRVAMDSNPLLHVQFPTKESLVALEEFLTAHTAATLRNPTSGVLVARDSDTGAIVSFAKWSSPSHPEETKLESGDLQQYSEGCCREALDQYIALAEEAKARSFGDKPCYRELPLIGFRRGKCIATVWSHFHAMYAGCGICSDIPRPREPRLFSFFLSIADLVWIFLRFAASELSFICTDPAFQGQGAGSLLTRKVMEMAREDGLPVYLESTDVAAPMYTRLGFHTIDRFEMVIPSRPSTNGRPEGVVEGRQEQDRDSLAAETTTYAEACMVWYPVEEGS